MRNDPRFNRPQLLSRQRAGSPAPSCRLQFHVIEDLGQQREQDLEPASVIRLKRLISSTESVRRIFSRNPMIPFSGVRISCDIFARNCDLSLLASSAISLAARSSAVRCLTRSSKASRDTVVFFKILIHQIKRTRQIADLIITTFQTGRAHVVLAGHQCRQTARPYDGSGKERSNATNKPAHSQDHKDRTENSERSFERPADHFQYRPLPC